MVSAKIKTTTLTQQDIDELDLEGSRMPTNWYIRDAMGNYVFIHCRARDKAQEYVNETYGKGKYIVKASKVTGKASNITAK